MKPMTNKQTSKPAGQGRRRTKQRAIGDERKDGTEAKELAWIERKKPSLKRVLGSDYRQQASTMGAYLELLAIIRELKNAREAKDLSLSELSQLTGIHPTAISRLENGRISNPTWETLHRIALALGKRIDWQVHSLPTGKSVRIRKTAV